MSLLSKMPTGVSVGPVIPTRTRMTRGPCHTAKSEIEVLSYREGSVTRPVSEVWQVKEKLSAPTVYYNDIVLTNVML